MRAYRANNLRALTISEPSPGLFRIKGELTFATITQDTLKSIDCSAKYALCVDLQEVAHADSAGLALMIEWLKLSKQQRGTLRFINIPAQLQALAKLSGLNHNLQSTPDH